MSNSGSAERYELTAEDHAGIAKLMTEKYETWHWNFGYSPNYNFRKAIKVPAGFIEVHLDVVKGIIEKARIFGDFFAPQPIEELETLLIGLKHSDEELRMMLGNVELSDYFGKVTTDEILTVFK